jgi:hypothetical protein
MARIVAAATTNAIQSAVSRQCARYHRPIPIGLCDDFHANWACPLDGPLVCPGFPSYRNTPKRRSGFFDDRNEPLL